MTLLSLRAFRCRWIATCRSRLTMGFWSSGNSLSSPATTGLPVIKSTGRLGKTCRTQRASMTPLIVPGMATSASTSAGLRVPKAFTACAASVAMLVT
jgi:hypothetical protein